MLAFRFDESVRPRQGDKVVGWFSLRADAWLLTFLRKSSSRLYRTCLRVELQTPSAMLVLRKIRRPCPQAVEHPVSKVYATCTLLGSCFSCSLQNPIEDIVPRTPYWVRIGNSDSLPIIASKTLGQPCLMVLQLAVCNARLTILLEQAVDLLEINGHNPAFWTWRYRALLTKSRA